MLHDDCKNYFELEESSPYMLLVSTIRKDLRKELPSDFLQKSMKDKLASPLSNIPAVTHVDFSARIQTVDADSNAKLFQLLNAFKKKTGYSVLVNTSFNVREEPIVCTPEDAFRCFQKTAMDYLVIQDFLFEKN